MLTKVSVLEKLTVQASDADLGKVKDVYFDSNQWTIRYLVIDTRKWLPGKKVLVSPTLIETVDIVHDTLVLKASQEQLKNGPTLDEHEPISRKIENELHSYYGWDPYWLGNGVSGSSIFENDMTSAAGQYAAKTEIQKELLEDEEIPLRSADELTGKFNGYSLQAKDKEMGQVVDFMFDDESWTIQYWMIDTGDVLPGFKLFVSTELIKKVDIIKKQVWVDEPSKEIAKKSGTIIKEEDLGEIAGDPVEKIRNKSII